MAEQIGRMLEEVYRVIGDRQEKMPEGSYYDLSFCQGAGQRS